MAAIDFKKLLSKPLDDVTRPPALPPGTYYGTITKHTFQESPWTDRETGEKEPQVNFFISIGEVGDDVDAQEAKAAGANGKLVNRAFSIAEGKEWPLKMFLEGLGITTEGKTLDSAIPETSGSSVMFEITQRVDKNDPSRVFNDVKNVRARE
jgi:hypothetical protein